MRVVALGSVLVGSLGGLAAGGVLAAAPLSAPPTGTVCPAVPDGAALVVADASGVAVERTSGTERLSLPALATAATLAVRGPDGTVWVEAPSVDTEVVETPASEPGDGGTPANVFRVAPGSSEAVEAARGEVTLMSAGWLEGRTAAVIVDYSSDRAREHEETYGAVLVDFANGEQRDVRPAGGIEFGVSSATIGAGRIVEGAYADLTEAFGTYDPAGTRYEDWPSPISSDEYNRPPLYQWPVASIAPGATAPTWAWVEGPDWDLDTSTIEGGWSLVVADPVSRTESLRLDLGEPGAWLVHADFDGRFWVGTFADDPDPADPDTVPIDEPPARVLVVDTADPDPAVLDAGCAAGIAATLDRNGTPAPPPVPAPTTTTLAPTTAAPTTAAPTTVARCTYVEADDAYPLRECDKGPAVRAVQEQINKRGQSIDADGFFGPGTEQAVRNFQEAAGLEVDGLVGPDTWAALYTGDPAGADDDGSGTVDPWEVSAPAPPGGDAASLVGLVFDIQMPDGTVHAADGALIPGLSYRGGWVIGLSDDPPFFGGEYVTTGGRHVLWMYRADGRNPDGTLMARTVVAAIDVPLSDGQSVEFGECQVDGASDMAVAAVTAATELDGFRPAVSAWTFDTAAGTITPIDAGRVRCAIIGD